jgi:hypothetical protein
VKDNLIQISEINGTGIWASWDLGRIPRFRLYRPFGLDQTRRIYYFRSYGPHSGIVKVKEKDLYTKYFRPFVVEIRRVKYYPVDSSFKLY